MPVGSWEHFCYGDLTFVGAFSCSVVPGIFGNQLNYCVDVINQMLVQALGCQHKEVGTL